MNARGLIVFTVSMMNAAVVFLSKCGNNFAIRSTAFLAALSLMIRLSVCMVDCRLSCRKWSKLPIFPAHVTFPIPDYCATSSGLIQTLASL